MPAAAHKGLMDALLAVQAEMPKLPKDATNPHFRSKYTPLDTIVEVAGPLLAKHGLVWSTFPCRDGQGEPALRYKLTHAATGESESDTMPLLVQKADPQGMGSALTYARRYSLTAVLNLVADEDDDGNGASRSQSRAPQAPPVELVSEAEIEELQAVAAGLSPQEIKLVLAELGIAANGWAQVPKASAAKLAKALSGAERAS